MNAVALGLPPMRVRSLVRPADQRSPGRPDTPHLVDRFGRRARDLRVSLTDRCNLRCTYCMPAEGLDWLPEDRQLTDAELVRLIRIAVERLGVEQVRLTGGEPLLRRGVEGLVAAISRLVPRPEISLTTNGLALGRKAAGLAAAGLTRVNVSLDSTDPTTFAALTRRDRLPDVLDGLAAARAAGLGPVKINAVLLRGVNDTQAVDLLRFAVDGGYHLRFIEQMPLDAGHSWSRQDMVTADEILERLSGAFDLRPHPAPRAGAPAELFDVTGTSIDGAPATVGIIASVTRPFCGDCERTRLTADGALRNCLFSRSETDLRALLRAGAGDEDIAGAWRAGMWTKAAGHGIDDDAFRQPDRPMSAIGG